MSGEQLKRKIHEAGYTVDQLSLQLGYKNRQRLYAELNHQSTKTDLIERLSAVTGIRIGWWFGEGDMYAVPTGNGVSAKERRNKRGNKIAGQPVPTTAYEKPCSNMNGEEWAAYVDATMKRLLDAAQRLDDAVRSSQRIGS